jgi:hypothetical protein
MMWRRLLLLDLVLATALVFGVLQVKESWREFEATHRPENIQPEKETVRGFQGSTPVATTAEDWTDISVKDPFSFDRNDVSIVAPKQAPPNLPKPVLFGTMAIGNDRIAMLASAQSGRTSRPIKVGESLDDWEVVEIRDKAVVVTNSTGIRETLIVNDPKAQVARSSERTGATTASAPPPVTVITPTPSQPSASTGGDVVRPQTPATPPPSPSTGGCPDGILQTPFGPVCRTK